eukprot:1159825-Pelagomonas_calceolata.AAC.3
MMPSGDAMWQTIRAVLLRYIRCPAIAAWLKAEGRYFSQPTTQQPIWVWAPHSESPHCSCVFHKLETFLNACRKRLYTHLLLASQKYTACTDGSGNHPFLLAGRTRPRARAQILTYTHAHTHSSAGCEQRQRCTHSLRVQLGCHPCLLAPSKSMYNI